MRVDLDYKIPAAAIERSKKKDEDVPTSQEMTQNFIWYAVNEKHKNGIGSRDRKIWGRIQRKFEAAVDSKASTIELETAEIEFIVDAFKDAKFPPADARYIVILEEEMDRLGKELDRVLTDHK